MRNYKVTVYVKNSDETERVVFTSANNPAEAHNRAEVIVKRTHEINARKKTTVEQVR